MTPSRCRNVFDVQKLRLTANFFLFQTILLHFGGYSATDTKTRALILKQMLSAALKHLIIVEKPYKASCLLPLQPRITFIQFCEYLLCMFLGNVGIDN